MLGGIDNNPNCKDTYEKNNHTNFYKADIAELEESELEAVFGICKNDDNLIFVGCSPCQYYTNLKTDKTRSENSKMLLEEFQRFVEYYKPGYIFIENVPGLEKKDDSPLRDFQKFLSANSYVFDDGVINAKYYGVPQNRRRYVLIASRVKKEIELPEADKENLITVKDAIGDKAVFPIIEAGQKDDTTFMHTAAGLSQLNLKRIKKTPKNGGSRKIWANDPELQLDCYKEHVGHWDVYGRMRWDAVSPAITTRFNSLSNGRYGHPEQDRAISLREGATLQSFPYDYTFYGTSQSSITKLIGNAVPPKFSKMFGLSINRDY